MRCHNTSRQAAIPHNTSNRVIVLCHLPELGRTSWYLYCEIAYCDTMTPRPVCHTLCFRRSNVPICSRINGESVADCATTSEPLHSSARGSCPCPLYEGRPLSLVCLKCRGSIAGISNACKSCTRVLFLWTFEPELLPFQALQCRRVLLHEVSSGVAKMLPEREMHVCVCGEKPHGGFTAVSVWAPCDPS